MIILSQFTKAGKHMIVLSEVATFKTGKDMIILSQFTKAGKHMINLS